jgi:hypothetical protein
MIMASRKSNPTTSTGDDDTGNAATTDSPKVSHSKKAEFIAEFQLATDEIKLLNQKLLESEDSLSIAAENLYTAFGSENFGVGNEVWHVVRQKARGKEQYNYSVEIVTLEVKERF